MNISLNIFRIHSCINTVILFLIIVFILPYLGIHFQIEESIIPVAFGLFLIISMIEVAGRFRSDFITRYWLSGLFLYGLTNLGIIGIDIILIIIYRDYDEIASNIKIILTVSIIMFLPSILLGIFSALFLRILLRMQSQIDS